MVSPSKRVILWAICLALSFLRLVSSAPAPCLHELDDPDTEVDRRPLVIWHGLGDSYGSPGMLSFIEELKKMKPGLFVYSVRLDEDLKEDQKAGWFGNVDEQLEKVYEQLQSIPELADGFDGIGFSQGGQFLRAYVERYNDPPMNNLITFGSQHMGVSDVPGCAAGDWFCMLARSVVKRGVYTEYAQTNIVQAQYFRDPANLDAFLATNHFLTDINNEVQADFQNLTYRDNLVSINKLVMILFTEDKTVVPKESSWFGSYAPPEDDEEFSAEDETTIIPMRMQKLYTEDWIGLREIDERGDVVLDTCEGGHMHISRECLVPIVEKYVGAVLYDDDGEERTSQPVKLVIQD